LNPSVSTTYGSGIGTAKDSEYSRPSAISITTEKRGVEIFPLPISTILLPKYGYREGEGEGEGLIAEYPGVTEFE
jgi:hypothetical protein